MTPSPSSRGSVPSHSLRGSFWPPLCLRKACSGRSLPLSPPTLAAPALRAVTHTPTPHGGHGPWPWFGATCPRHVPLPPQPSVYELVRAPGFARLSLIVEDFVKDAGASFSGELGGGDTGQASLPEHSVRHTSVTGPQRVGGGGWGRRPACGSAAAACAFRPSAPLQPVSRMPCMSCWTATSSQARTPAPLSRPYTACSSSVAAGEARMGPGWAAGAGLVGSPSAGHVRLSVPCNGWVLMFVLQEVRQSLLSPPTCQWPRCFQMAQLSPEAAGILRPPGTLPP